MRASGRTIRLKTCLVNQPGRSYRFVAVDRNREVGMDSSAVYRYFASREDLLAELIIAAYNDVGAAAEATETTGRVADRWLRLARAIRAWAVRNP